MADTKISALAAASALAGTEALPGVQSGNDVKITPAQILTYFIATWLDTDTALAANSDLRIASQKAVKAYVDAAVTGLLDFKGATSCSGNPNYPAASKGDAYIVSAAGKIGGASGVAVDIGDVFVASADNAGGTQASVGASWFVLEHNLAGALLAANNLSDLASAAAARTNLGLVPGTDVFKQRTITGTANEITVTNGDGVSGAPTISLPGTLVLTGKAMTGGTFSATSFITTADDVSGFITVGRYTPGGASYIIASSGATALNLQVGGVDAIQIASGTVKFAGVGTTASAANAYLDSGAGNSLLRSTSSKAYKRDIEPLDPEIARKVLAAAEPVWFRSRAAADNPDHSFYGHISEEVAKIDPRLVFWGYREADYFTRVDKVRRENEAGELVEERITTRHLRKGAKLRPEGVQYDRLAAVQIHALKLENEDLRGRVAKLEAFVASFETGAAPRPSHQE
jgi:hypothetical protein